MKAYTHPEFLSAQPLTRTAEAILIYHLAHKSSDPTYEYGLAPHLHKPSALRDDCQQPVKSGLSKPQLSHAEFLYFKRLIYQLTRIELPIEKKILVSTRLEKRLLSLNFNYFSEYQQFLNAEFNCESPNLINTLTTNITSFFRESHHFDALLAQIRQDRDMMTGKRPIRIWSAGCSTGQEPYSIALSLLSHPDFNQCQVSIVATDINTDALQRAQLGWYDDIEVQSLPTPYLFHFFSLSPISEISTLTSKNISVPFSHLPPKTVFKINNKVKQNISFQYQNLFDTWDLPDPFDFIFCRNVTIYFSTPDQAWLHKRFAEQLTTHGHLFIGQAEQINPQARAFKKVGASSYQRVY